MRLMTPRLKWTIVGALLSMLAFAAVNFQWPMLLHRSRTMTDFDAFYVTGHLFWEGRLLQAYDFTRLLAAQHRFTGTISFMPWTYPPPFDFVAAAIGTLPIGIAYLLFTGLSALAYIAAIRRLAGPHTGTVLLAIFPALLLNVRTGQNGFLIGALLGFYLSSHLRGNPRGGVALGCMIIKPHLAVPAAILPLIGRNWRCVAAASGTSASLLLISGLAFGWQIFGAFGHSLHDAGTFLAGGYYPLFRMVSLYAALYTAGAPPIIAMICQAILAVAACGTAVFAARRLEDRRLVVGVAAFACLFVSPYCYDYDLTLLGVAAAAVAPMLLESTRPVRLLPLLPLAWFASGWGMIVTAWTEDTRVSAAALGSIQYPSLGWPALVLVLCVTWTRLRSRGVKSFVERDPALSEVA
jgi:hypothetical protein